MKVKESHSSCDALLGDVVQLFISSNNARNTAGITPALQQSFVRETIADNDNSNMTEFVDLNINNSPDCECKEEETCDKCESELDICSVSEMLESMGGKSAYSGLDDLLSTVKKYEYFSLIENAYAQIGNKPFKLKANKSPQASDDEIESAAIDFYAYLEKYLSDNEVRVHEIPDAFDLSTLTEVSDSLEKSAKNQAKRRLDDSIEIEEDVLERIFKRANLMKEYIEVKKDTANYPIGILWADDLAMKKEKYVDDGVLKIRRTIQCDATRIDPCYFWATPDYRLHKAGTAVFKLVEYSTGEMRSWADSADEVEEFISENPYGYKDQTAVLFSDHAIINRGLYDVFVCRGWFEKSKVSGELKSPSGELKSTMPKEYDTEDYIPCEIHFTQGKLLKVRVLELVDEFLGVYTTTFRRNGSSIFGYSLHQFISPFTKLYASMIDAVDKNMANSTSAIIQMDRGVISDPEKYLTINKKTGEAELDFSKDWIVEFDSSDVFNPNFKGFPIHVTQLPSNLDKLLPLRDFIIRELELLSGIPSILISSNNISSALRTTDNFNAAFTASAKVIQALLRESEERILKPVVQYFFDAKARKGEMRQFLIDAEPEILLSDTLSRDHNESQVLLQGVQMMASIGGDMIPREKFASLLNRIGKELYNLDDDLISGASPIGTTNPSSETQSV